jgi:hypothetical protein
MYGKGFMARSPVSTNTTFGRFELEPLELEADGLESHADNPATTATAEISAQARRNEVMSQAIGARQLMTVSVMCGRRKAGVDAGQPLTAAPFPAG